MAKIERSEKSQIIKILTWLLLLALVWLLWSGIYKPIVICLGVFSCFLTAYISYRAGFFQQSTTLHVIPRIPRYLFSLFVDIVKSSIDVSRIILSPKLSINPVELKLEAAPKGPVGQVILANSITLSPGTMTIDVHEGKFHIHCLTQAGADEIIASNINQRAAELTDK